MCTKPKIPSVATETEEIKKAVQADASVQKSNVKNRAGENPIINPNIKTSNNGVEDEIISSKKKLLGE